MTDNHFIPLLLFSLLPPLPSLLSSLPVFPPRHRGRSLFHAGRRLGEIGKFLLQIPLRAGQFGLTASDAFLPWRQRLLAIFEGLGALLKLFRFGMDSLLEVHLDRSVSGEILLSRGDLSGLRDTLPCHRLLRLPLSFELYLGGLDSFFVPGQVLRALGEPGLEFAEGRFPFREGLRLCLEGGFSPVGLSLRSPQFLGL